MRQILDTRCKSLPIPCMLRAMEPAEMGEFAKDMREAGEASLTRVSLIISVLAVLVAMVTVLGHREHTEAVLAQARASDRWSEYQGRRVRQSQLAVAADVLSLQAGVPSNALQAKLTEFKGRQQKIQEQLNEDTAEAKSLEGEVSLAERRASRLDLGEALLQISVVLASITLLTRRWWYVLAAIALGTVGLAAAAAAFLVR